MKGCSKVITACGLIIQAAAALSPEASVTAVHNINIAVRGRAKNLHIRAIAPTEKGEIGINPPGVEPTPANIEGHTKYLTLEGSSTKWIGSDPNHVAVATTTITKQGGETAVATITKGVSAIKAADGGLNILFGPAVKAKLEAIAKQVTPCPAKRKRAMRNGKRGGPACGLADFVQRVGADEELQGSFAEPLTDQIYHEVDEGYSGDDPAEDPGWEGDGSHGEVHEDEGYYSDDDEGFFEGAEGAEGEGAADTLETIVISSEEEAAAIAAGLAGGEAAAAAGIWGGSTVTAGSTLAFIWTTLTNGKPLDHAIHVPKESIHKISKTKTKTEGPSSTASPSSSCPAPTASLPSCGDCKPTSVKVEGAKSTDIVDWACSEGSTKGCKCSPKIAERITVVDSNFHQAILDAESELKGRPQEPVSSCGNDISNVPSEFFVGKTSTTFCEAVMSNLANDVSSAGTAYDIDGNKIPNLKMAMVAAEGGAARRALQRRSPPESSKNYLDYRFFLEYKHQDGECWMPKENLCKDAWEKLVKSPCGSNHGSAGDRMFVDATIDVGCGTFKWHVEAPPKEPEKPTLSKRQCHDAHKHYDVHSAWVDTWSSFLCEEGKKIKPGDPEIYWHPVGGDYHQNYKISWIEGCSVTTEQSVKFPIEGDKNIVCGNLLRDNYYDCNNGGAGGQIDAGCVRYDFYVT